MGACYSIVCKFKIKENMEEKIVETLNAKIDRAKEENVDYGVERHYPDFKKPYNLEELMKIFFVEHQKDFSYEKEGNEIKIDSGFNASYGWEFVMYTAVRSIAPYLEDGSRLYLDGEGSTVYRVKNGILK